MRNLTAALNDPDSMELKQLLAKVISGVEKDLDILQDAQTALSRDPAKVNVARSLLGQTIESIRKKLQSAKSAQKKLEARG